MDQENIPQRFLEALRDEFGSDLILLIHHGSRASGDHRPESDYDFIVGLQTVDADRLLRLRKVVRSSDSFEKVQCIVLSDLDFEQFICTHRHQFHFARKLLHGEVPFGPPTKEQEVEEIGLTAMKWAMPPVTTFCFPTLPSTSTLAAGCSARWRSCASGFGSAC